MGTVLTIHSVPGSVKNRALLILEFALWRAFMKIWTKSGANGSKRWEHRDKAFLSRNSSLMCMFVELKLLLSDTTADACSL